jgi:hypothetical protein
VFVVFGLPFIAAAVAAGVAGEWVIVPIVGLIVLGPTIAIWGHLRYSRIVVTPEEIVVRGFVVHRRLSRARAARVARANVVQPRAGIVDTVFVLDATGGLLIHIYGRHYRRADIDRLVAFLELPSVAPDRLVTANQLSSLYSGIVPWYEAHSLRLGLYAAGGAAVAILAAGLILTLLASPL